jgi:hypothetical protein
LSFLFASHLRLLSDFSVPRWRYFFRKLNCRSKFICIYFSLSLSFVRTISIHLVGISLTLHLIAYLKINLCCHVLRAKISTRTRRAILLLAHGVVFSQGHINRNRILCLAVAGKAFHTLPYSCFQTCHFVQRPVRLGRLLPLIAGLQWLL